MAIAGAALALAGAGVMSGGCGGGDDPPPGELVADGGGVPEAAQKFPEAAPPGVIGPRVECALGAAIEEEPNDTPATANAFTELSFCGVLETATDVDYVTFDTPAGTKLSVFQAVIDGKVELELTLNGGATFGPAETAKFGEGKYLVKAFTKAGKPASYRIRVQFDAP